MNSPSTLSFSFDTFPKESAGCSACLGRVLERLQSLNGVETVEVETDRRRIKVAIEDGYEKARLQNAAEKIIREVASGYGHESFRVGGMDCPSCAKEIEHAIKKMPGILACSVDFSTSRMRLELLKDKVANEEISRSVKQLGFSAKPLFAPEEGLPISEIVSLIMGGALWFIAAFIPNDFAKAILFCLATVVSAHKMLLAGIYGLLKFSYGMNVLMTVAVVGALAIKEWPEAALAAWLFACGNLVQIQASKKTRSSVKALLESAPKTARKIYSNEIKEVDVSQASVGDLVEILPHSQIPLDGIVETGYGFVNNASLTGESEPVPIAPGIKLLAGGINDDSLLTMKVSSRFEDSIYSKTLELIEQGQSSKAPQQEMIDRFAAWYTPLMILIAIFVAVIPPLAGWLSWQVSMHQAFWLLMVACPCALILSAPVASVSAIGAAGKLGALVKGGAHLDALAIAKRWVFDKTGTLTHARLELSGIEILGDKSEDEVLMIAASLAQKSNHPVSKAILRNSKSRLEPENVQVFAGEGVTGQIQNRVYKLGNASFLNVEKSIGTEALLGDENSLLARFRFADKPKSEAAQAIKELQSEKLRTALLSGDEHRSVQPLASALNLEDYKGNLSPAEKAEYVSKWNMDGGVVMVGDGINDLAALQRARVSIAMGAAGSESAIESADIVLLNDRIENLPKLRNIGKRYRAVMAQNIAFSLITKAGLIVIGAIFTGLPFWLAVAGDMGVALLVTANALRIKS